MSALAKPAARAAPAREHAETFDCFGSRCTVIVADPAGADLAGRAVANPADPAGRAVAVARRWLLEWHQQFSRFEPDSELSRLNRDERTVVPISPMMRRVLQAALRAAELSGGLVDATLVGEIERAGYRADLSGTRLPLPVALAGAGARTPAGPSPARAWQAIEVDRRAGTVARPPGVRLDPGGIAKGVFADELGTLLSAHDAFVVDCAGDIRLGGRARTARPVHVESPFDGSVLHTFALQAGGVTTSSIAARAWRRPDGAPAHHLLDPRSGRPAFTGIVQATALAPSAAEAEVRSKAAILSGPRDAHDWLPHGGVIVFDDGSHRVLEPA
jgi:thiamine biosynthesis lipoprotein